jgi:hypothetical protein
LRLRASQLKIKENQQEKRMSNHIIYIPDSLYEKAQRVAEQSSQNVDELIIARLEGALAEPSIKIPPDERAELLAMKYLSDDTLWTIAREQMQTSLQERTSLLINRNQAGTITELESSELSELVERGDKLMLRKSQAMRYLAERGQIINLDKLKPSDE